MEAAALGSGLDDPLDDACHLGCYGDIGHALAIRAEGIFPDVSFELLLKAVLSLLDCYDSGHPEGASRTSVAELEQLGDAAELAGVRSTRRSPLLIAQRTFPLAGLVDAICNTKFLFDMKRSDSLAVLFLRVT
ncbi:MAG: hypothetical protein ACLGPM_03355 [Acidobacteriota bacterium]